MENINNLHEKHFIKNGNRTFNQVSGSIMLKSGSTKNLTKKEAEILFKQVEKGDFIGNIDVEIEFKTESEGLEIAKTFKSLAQNPLVKLNVTFKRKTNNE